MNKVPAQTWVGITRSLAPMRFTCGYCGALVSSTDGWFNQHDSSRAVTHFIYVCGGCGAPSYFENGFQHPLPKPGAPVDALPDEIATLYEELRGATSAGAFTAVVILARTVIAQVAVDKSAALGESFLFYVNWLETNGYTTAPMKPWVDHVRLQANVSAHELRVMNRDEATRSLKFIEMLLRIVYEFPAAVPAP